MLKHTSVAAVLACGLAVTLTGCEPPAQVTERVSVSSNEGQANGDSDIPAITSGQFVTFRSNASTLATGDTNLVEDIFVGDRTAGITRRVSVADDGSQLFAFIGGGSMSGDGRYVLFCYGGEPGCSDCFDQLYLRDRTARTTEVVSVSSAEELGSVSDIVVY